MKGKRHQSKPKPLSWKHNIEITWWCVVMFTVINMVMYYDANLMCCIANTLFEKCIINVLCVALLICSLKNALLMSHWHPCCIVWSLHNRLLKMWSDAAAGLTRCCLYCRYWLAYTLTKLLHSTDIIQQTENRNCFFFVLVFCLFQSISWDVKQEVTIRGATLYACTSPDGWGLVRAKDSQFGGQSMSLFVFFRSKLFSSG